MNGEYSVAALHQCLRSAKSFPTQMQWCLNLKRWLSGGADFLKDRSLMSRKRWRAPCSTSLPGHCSPTDWGAMRLNFEELLRTISKLKGGSIRLISSEHRSGFLELAEFYVAQLSNFFRVSSRQS